MEKLGALDMDKIREITFSVRMKEDSDQDTETSSEAVEE